MDGRPWSSISAEHLPYKSLTDEKSACDKADDKEEAEENGLDEVPRESRPLARVGRPRGHRDEGPVHPLEGEGHVDVGLGHLCSAPLPPLNQFRRTWLSNLQLWRPLLLRLSVLYYFTKADTLDPGLGTNSPKVRSSKCLIDHNRWATKWPLALFSKTVRLLSTSS